MAAPLDLTPALRPERTALIELLRALSADAWEVPTECPAWNVKGLALHILGDDLSLLTRQRDASTNSLIMFAEDHPGLSFRELLDGFNEQWVTASRFLSNDLLIAMLGLVGHWSDTFYGEIGLETMSAEPVGLFAETQPSPYWQVIAREYLERFTHHSQIRRAVAAVDLDATFATPAARVCVHLLAAWLASYTPAIGSTISLDLGGVGTWSWKRESDRWSAFEGSDQNASARIRVVPTAVVTMLSRGMVLDEVVGNLAVEGDDRLADGVVHTIAPLLGRPSD